MPYRVIALLIVGFGLVIPAFGLSQERSVVDPALKPYKNVSGLSGTLNTIGSDTMNNLMILWAEAFRRQYPNVKIQVEGKGSRTAPPALIEGTAQLGPMSRRMKESEIDKFEAKFGYKPVCLLVAIDAVTLYVNKDNPLRRLTMEQVNAIFSKNRRLGAKEAITKWSQLGLGAAWVSSQIRLYGRNSASGTYSFFKERALKNGDFNDDVKEQPGSASVVQGITEDRYGLGYSGIGYLTSGVHMLALAETAKGPFLEPTLEEAKKGAYPLTRHLYIYVNQAPGQPLAPLVQEFLSYVYSRDGQADVLKDGFFPLDGALVQVELGKIN